MFNSMGISSECELGFASIHRYIEYAMYVSIHYNSTQYDTNTLFVCKLFNTASNCVHTWDRPQLNTFPYTEYTNCHLHAISVHSVKYSTSLGINLTGYIQLCPCSMRIPTYSTSFSHNHYPNQNDNQSPRTSLSIPKHTFFATNGHHQ